MIPAITCPDPTVALAGVGASAVCGAAGSVVGSVAGSLGGSIITSGANDVLGALGSWVASGAQWLIDQIGAVLESTTAIDLGAPWFARHYQAMVTLSGVVILPFLLLGVVQALWRQDLSRLIRSVLVHVPLALLLTGVAVQLVQWSLALVDSLSAWVAEGSGLDAGHILASVAGALAPTAAANASVPAAITFLGGLLVMLGATMVWLELVIRSAAVYVAVLFLPLALISLAWPAVAHWCRRLVDTLVALVLSKFVIVAVLSLAVGAVDAGVSSSTSAGFRTILAGAALLLLAAFAPFSLFKLLPMAEAGAIGHFEGMAQRVRHRATAPVRPLAQVALRGAAAAQLAAGGLAGGALAAGAGGAALDSSPVGADAFSGAPVGEGPVGSHDTAPPGSSIPLWPVHEEATAALRAEVPPTSAAQLVGTRPVPAPSGTRLRDGIGFDAYGPRLVSIPFDDVANAGSWRRRESDRDRRSPGEVT